MQAENKLEHGTVKLMEINLSLGLAPEWERRSEQICVQT